MGDPTIRPDAARLHRSRPPDHKNPLAGPDGMPGVAFQWMEVEGPLYDSWPPAGHRLLFGDLPMTNRPAAPAQVERRRRFQPAPGVEVIPSASDPDGEQLVRRFLQRAYRRPVAELVAWREELRTELVKLLRHSHAGRLPRARGSSRFTGLQNMTPIALRPPEVASRIVPGHWEADLIKGAGNASAVGTIVERTSRFLMLARMDNASAMSVLDGFSKRLRTVPASLRKTLTYDQGTEMALHQDLAKRLRMDIYFCDPHSPWQRGTNENMNGLVREYLPKGTSLASLTDADLRRIEDSINNRPRKLLGYYTPAEVFSALRQDDILGVALHV